MRAVVIGCGKSKRKKPSKAKNMYTSTYFGLKYDAAKKIGGDIYILSAKYGLLEPNEVIEPYNKKMSDLTSSERRDMSENVSRQLAKYSEVIMLAGKDYRDIVVHDNVSSPFEGTSGIHEQMSVLSKIAND